MPYRRKNSDIWQKIRSDKCRLVYTHSYFEAQIEKKRRKNCAYQFRIRFFQFAALRSVNTGASGRFGFILQVNFVPENIRTRCYQIIFSSVDLIKMEIARNSQVILFKKECGTVCTTCIPTLYLIKLCLALLFYLNMIKAMGITLHWIFRRFSDMYVIWIYYIDGDPVKANYLTCVLKNVSNPREVILLKWTYHRFSAQVYGYFCNTHLFISSLLTPKDKS